MAFHVVIPADKLTKVISVVKHRLKLDDHIDFDSIISSAEAQKREPPTHTLVVFDDESHLTIYSDKYSGDLTPLEKSKLRTCLKRSSLKNKSSYTRIAEETKGALDADKRSVYDLESYLKSKEAFQAEETERGRAMLFEAHRHQIEEFYIIMERADQKNRFERK